MWVVFDKDQHKFIANAYNKANTNKINIAISIICFEYWILLHFKQTTKPFRKCDYIVDELRKKYLSHYSKSNNCFNSLRNNINTAIQNANWVEKQKQLELKSGKKIYELDAYTNIHKLVKQLI